MNLVRSALAALVLLAAHAHADRLKDHLSVFFEMEPQDTVVALEQLSPTLLKITVADPATGQIRYLKEEVGARPMEKLLIESNDMGLKTIHWSPPEEVWKPAADSAPPGKPVNPPVTQADSAIAVPAPVPVAPPRPKTAANAAAEHRNRMWYLGTQTILSTYVYGVAIPNAYENVSVKARVAAPMIVAPFAFGVNFWYSKNHPFQDSHLKGTTYLSVASLYASYAIPFSLINWDEEPYRFASFLSMGAYPLGIWSGYKLGEKYVDRPGRIDTEMKFALGFGAMGFFSPWLYFDNVNDHSEAILRLGLGQSVVLATAGHFLADQYRSGQNIPDGVNTGILHHTLLGAAAGLEIAAIFDASTVRPWLGAALFGGTLGFMEGLYYYRDSYDSPERGVYNSLGTGAGLLMGGGFAYLFYDGGESEYWNKNLVTGMLVGGAWLGYCVTNLLTDGMEDRTGRGRPAWRDRLAVNLFPLPEPASRDRELYMRFRVPGVSYRF